MMETMTMSTPSEQRDPVLSSPQDHFPLRLHKLLCFASENGFHDIASWSSCGSYFRIHDKTRFKEDLLPEFFPSQRHFKSFMRQISLYKMSRVSQLGPLKGFYFHPSFHRDAVGLCFLLKRESTRNRRTKNVSMISHTATINDAPVHAPSSSTSIADLPSLKVKSRFPSRCVLAGGPMTIRQVSIGAEEVLLASPEQRMHVAAGTVHSKATSSFFLTQEGRGAYSCGGIDVDTLFQAGTDDDNNNKRHDENDVFCLFPDIFNPRTIRSIMSSQPEDMHEAVEEIIKTFSVVESETLSLPPPLLPQSMEGRDADTSMMRLLEPTPI